MATLQEIRRDPSYLGYLLPEQEDEAVILFCDAVNCLTAEGLDEAAAVRQVWGNGDWVPRAEAIIAGG